MSQTKSATAVASPNIALIKYWGNRDHQLRLPRSPSISFNLAGLYTRTKVTWFTNAKNDHVTINGETAGGPAYQRVTEQLNHVRGLANHAGYAIVESENNFPQGAGIASSAAAFAALSLAAATALQLRLSERELSALARLGSGSAARSIPGGFVEWHAGNTHASSYAETFAGVEHWPLVDLVAVVSRAHKKTGSTSGHVLASTSPLQEARIASAQARFTQCKQAVLDRDFMTLAEVVELDSNVMHAVMMTSTPPLFYWEPATLAVMDKVRQWRSDDGLEVCYTIDAGPNVHCICTPETADRIEAKLRGLPGILDVLRAAMGGPASIETR